METLSAFPVLLPCLIAVILGIIVTHNFSSTEPWARAIIILSTFILTIRYLIWRSLDTLNLTNNGTTIISIIVLLLEIFSWTNVLIGLFLSIKREYHHQEAEKYEQIVKSGKFQPTVDILIPTYNESVNILRRTIIGCQAMDYDNKTIYILDDGNRPEIKELTRQLGCQYLTRNEQIYAKAGNLNHALPLTHSELIAVFDADFIPCRNFLSRTVGFFQQPKLALLQTHQQFYNEDPIAKNLGLGKILGHPTEELSALQTQPARSYFYSGMCYGSSFVIRRAMLEEIGGFYPKSITEDLFTTIVLLTKKYDTLYLAESLSAGLSPENIPSLFRQRIRWAKGTIQGLFLDANPLTIKGLKLIQRLIYGSSLIYWFNNITLVLMLVLFPLSFIMGIPPLVINFYDWLNYFLPLLLFQLVTSFWLNDHVVSKIISEVYSLILSFPVSLAIIQTLISPFSGGFTVTPKGITNHKTIFYWRLALPLFYIWLISFFSTIICTIIFFHWEDYLGLVKLSDNFYGSAEVGLFWNIYNLFIISLAILGLIEKPQIDPYPWIEVNTKVNLFFDNFQLQGITTAMSENGLKLTFDHEDYLSLIKPNSSIEIEITELKLKLTGIMETVNLTKQKTNLVINYSNLSIEEYRQLVKFLFCLPRQWQPKKLPSELLSFLILCRVLINSIFSLPQQFKQEKISPNLIKIKTPKITINY